MQKESSLNRVRQLSALVAATSLLAACGGGSSPPPPPPPPAASLTITGTAATGAAIAGGAVVAKCSGGSGNATTASNGTYTISLTTGTLPCTLEVTPTTGAKLHSVATGSGATATANITPLTELIVAKLAGKDPATYFSGFGATDITALTTSIVTAAQTAVVGTLKSSGVDASTLGNLITASLVVGNAMDQILDVLKTKLTTAGITLADLTALIVNTVPGTTPPSTVTLPPDVALQAGAASCPALRSGIFRYVNPQIGPTGDHGAASTGTLVFDAASLTTTGSDGSTSTITPVAGTPCRFTNSNGASFVVSQAGVVAVETSAPVTWGIIFPEQTIAVADLAGDWNFLGFDRSNLTDPLVPKSLTASVNSAGAVTITRLCDDAKSNCITTGLPTATFTTNVAGGFDLTFSNGDQSRGAAFRAGNGDLMLIIFSGDGTWEMGTRARVNTLPTAGSTRQGWSVDAITSLVNGSYTQAGVAITDYSNTIVSVDSAGGTFVRNNVTNFTTTPQVTRPETIEVNSVAGVARNGYNYRRPATGVLNSAGTAVNVPEFIQLPLPGTGLVAVALPGASPLTGTGRYSLAVAKP